MGVGFRVYGLAVLDVGLRIRGFEVRVQGFMGF